MSQILRSKIAGVRGRLGIVSAATGIAMAVGALVVLIAIQMVLDFELLSEGLPWFVRAAFLAFDLALIAFILFRFTIYPLLFGPDDDEIALMMERHSPEFRSRLISAIQLVRPEAVPAGASASMVRAMISETESMAQPIDFKSVVKSDRLTKLSAAAILLVIFGAALVVYTKDVSAELLKRVMLGNNEVPRKTRITPVTYTKLLARGEDVTLAVIVDGVVPTDPSAQRVQLNYASKRQQETIPDRMPDAYATTIKGVKEPFRYRFVVVGVSTDWYTISVKGEAPLDPLPEAAVAPSSQPTGIETTCLTGSNQVERGANVVLAVAVKGVQDSRAPRVHIDIAPKSGHPEDEVEHPLRTVAAFSQSIANVQESFEYRFKLNDGTSRWQKVEALPRPSVSDITCTQVYPAYTNKQPANRLAGDLSLLAGSKLQVKIAANKPVRAGVVMLAGLNTRVPATVDAKDHKTLTAAFDIPAEKLNGFAVHLTDEDGIESRDEATYRIDVVPDKPPVVRITWPDRSDMLVTQKALVLLRYEASDDFGIQRVQLHFKVDKTGGQEQIVDLPLKRKPEDKGPATSIKDRFDWPLGNAQPLAPEGSVIEFWVEAMDNNNVTADGGKGLSEHFTLKVVSQAELNQDLLSRMNEYFHQFESTTSDQETTSDALGNILLGKPATRPTTQKAPAP